MGIQGHHEVSSVYVLVYVCAHLCLDVRDVGMCECTCVWIYASEQVCKSLSCFSSFKISVTKNLNEQCYKRLERANDSVLSRLVPEIHYHVAGSGMLSKNNNFDRL